MVKNKLAAIINATEDNSDFKPLTNTRPIAALPFAGRYRIIDFVLSNISHAGIDSTALFIGDSGRSLYDHIRSGDAWDLDSQIKGGIFTFSQQNWKLSMHIEQEHVDFYYNHRIYLSRSNAKYVFVTGSKIIANIDIAALQKQHIESGKDVTLVYKPSLKSAIGANHVKEKNLKFDENHNVIDLVENDKCDEGEIVNASLGMYLLSIETLNEIIDQAIEDDFYSNIDEVLQHYLLSYSVNTFEYTGFTANINSIENYYKANMDMLTRSNFAALFHTSLPILTKTKNGSPTYYSKDSNVKQSIVASGAFLAGDVECSVIHRRVSVKEGAIVKNSMILQGTEIGENARVEYAIIDKDCVVEPGAEIVGTPDNIVVIGKNTLVEAEGARI